MLLRFGVFNSKDYYNSLNYSVMLPNVLEYLFIRLRLFASIAHLSSSTHTVDAKNVTEAPSPHRGVTQRFNSGAVVPPRITIPL